MKDYEIKIKYKEAFMMNNGFPCEIQDSEDGLGYIVSFKNNKSKVLSAKDLVGFTSSLLSSSVKK
jgi:hypothetical protein